jgi:hypothetical protein
VVDVYLHGRDLTSLCVLRDFGDNDVEWGEAERED